MTPHFRGAPPCFQLGFITHSMEAMTAKLKATYGVPEFFMFPDVKFAELLYHGKPATCQVSVAIGYSGEMQIEVVQPLSGEAAYTEFLTSGGDGFHHVGFLTDDFDAQIEDLRRDGASIIQTGIIGEERAIKFAYIDTRSELGVFTEIICLSPSMKQLYEHIRKRSLRQLQQARLP